MDIKTYNRTFAFIGLVTINISSFAKPIVLPEFANGGVNADAIWSMYKDVVPGLYEHCHKITHEIVPFQKCVNSFMQYHGASKQAIAFYQKYDGFIKSINNYTNLATITTASLNLQKPMQLFFVNNQGWFFDTDDADSLKQLDLKQNAQYQKLHSKYPDISIGLNDHSISASHKAANDIQQFIINYELVNGCQTCDILGHARIVYNFNQQGKLLGIKLLDITANSFPIKHVLQEQAAAQLQAPEAIPHLANEQKVPTGITSPPGMLHTSPGG